MRTIRKRHRGYSGRRRFLTAEPHYCCTCRNPTAFAPATIGVPLAAQFSQQVIKQLFDIAQLYDHARELSVLAEDNQKAGNVCLFCSQAMAYTSSRHLLRHL
jgi:hypothetical protein